MDFNVNQLTPEQVSRIKANGGFSGSAKDGIPIELPTSQSPRVSVPIDGYASSVRPNVNDAEGNPTSHNRIKGLSKDFGKKLGAKASEAKQEQDNLQAARRAERESLNPANILTRLEYLERKVKSLEKKLNKKQSQDLTHEEVA